MAKIIKVSELKIGDIIELKDIKIFEWEVAFVRDIDCLKCKDAVNISFTVFLPKNKKLTTHERIK